MRSCSQGRRRSVDRGTCGPGIQPRKNLPPGRRRCRRKRKAPSGAPISRGAPESRAVRDPVHVPRHLAREPGDPKSAQGRSCLGTHREVQGRTPMTNGPGKSDSPVVPEKSPNNAGQPVAEGMEGRGLAKGNLPQQNASRIQSRSDAPSALERVRQAAGKDKKLRFTALLHHIYNLETLRMAYFSLKKEAAPGVDGETWRHYGEQLEVHLQDLSERLKRGAYRAKPVRRVFIPKADGRQRPLGVPALEDKIVQRAAVEVLNAIYETDFLDFSDRFRTWRSQHPALDALYTGLLTKKVNWVIDLGIRAFFDGLSHEWLVKFVEHRIADRRVVRLIQKWFRAGELEDGKRIRVEEGTPQGGSASPVLANVYLHDVFDLWVHAWRQKWAHGDVIVVRFADDIVVGFHSKAEADQFRAELTERMKKFHLELHPEKTRLLEFGPYAIDQREWRGEGKPETCKFLGFTQIW